MRASHPLRTLNVETVTSALYIAQRINARRHVSHCPRPGRGPRILGVVGGEHATDYADSSVVRFDPSNPKFEIGQLDTTLRDVGCVVWMIAPSQSIPDPDRDWPDTAAGAVLAGYSHATGRTVHVLRWKSSRSLADVGDRQVTLSGWGFFYE